LPGISPERTPTVRVDRVHFQASAEPASLPTAQFGGKRVGIVNEAQEQREVQALVRWHVVDIDRTRLDEDRTEQIRSRERPPPASETHADKFRPPEGLCPTRHLHRVRGRHGDSSSFVCNPSGASTSISTPPLRNT
jgi:hypothetical protein